QGGEVIFSGSCAGLEKSKRSLTGAYLSGRRRIERQAQRTPRGALQLRGARENNLKSIDVDIPLGVLVAVTGVSGAGKSTLINDILTPALERKLSESTAKVGAYDQLLGSDQIDRIIDIDQRPIGRTPRSNPVTYIKV